MAKGRQGAGFAGVIALIVITFFVGRYSGFRAPRDETGGGTSEPLLAHYCTQHGPISLRIEAELVAGIFVIRANGDVGSFSGTLEADTMKGEWIEPDSGGRIVIAFSPDRTRFEARYNVSTEADRWYEDWIGVIRPEGGLEQVEHDGMVFLCE